MLKDRPPENRTPLPEEMEACLPFLEEQLAIVQPSVICTLGAVATKALLGPGISITAVRGQLRDYQGMPLIPTFYNRPASLEEMARQFAYRALAHIGLPQPGAYRWKG